MDTSRNSLGWQKPCYSNTKIHGTSWYVWSHETGTCYFLGGMSHPYYQCKARLAVSFLKPKYSSPRCGGRKPVFHLGCRIFLLLCRVVSMTSIEGVMITLQATNTGNSETHHLQQQCRWREGHFGVKERSMFSLGYFFLFLMWAVTRWPWRFPERIPEGMRMLCFIFSIRFWSWNTR